jgi:long-chain fatty acid transport protein
MEDSMKVRILAALIACSLVSSELFALGSGGIGSEIISAKTLALSGSVLVEHDPGNVYLNPAMLSDMGQYNTSVGASYLSYSSDRSGSNGSDKMETTNVVIPNFAFAHSLMDGKIGIGLGVFSPYGLQTEWKGTSNVRYVATKSDIKMIDVTPAVSYRFTPQWAVGVGADYFSTIGATLEKKIPVDLVNTLLGTPTAGTPDGNSKLDGDGAQWGYHSSVLWTPTEKQAFSATYHSEVKTRIEGDLELTGLSGASAFVFGGTTYKTDAITDIFYPQNVQLGYRLSPSEAWKFYANAAWYNWSANNQLGIRLPNATATQKAVAETPIPLQWRDVWSFSLAASRMLNEKWTIDGGAYYEPYVYPAASFSPAVPDTDRYGLNIGTTYSAEKLSLSFVYNPIFMKKRSVTTSNGYVAGATPNISGDYKGTIHVVGVNARYHF